MPLRITDAISADHFITQVRASQQRIAVAQEQIATGKRINRPSDDPLGAGAVVRLRTTQTALEQYKRNAEVAHDSLLAADNAIEGYEQTLDRVRAVLTQGASSLTGQNAREAIAIEIDSLRAQILTVANQKHGEQFLFGGTRQEVPPYDSNGAPAAAPSTEQLLQFEPGGTLIATGLVGEDIFSDSSGPIFDLLEDVAAALRGTGNAATDQTTLLTGLDRLTGFADQSSIARTKIGVGIERAQATIEQLGLRSLALQESMERTEGADFVESAIELTESQKAFEALLQTKAVTGRRSLLDLLG
jgi:flagellar hook-associated protein 3 FlgL